jgi:hypothetical protein
MSSSDFRERVRNTFDVDLKVQDPFQLFLTEIKNIVNATFFAIYDEINMVDGKSEQWKRQTMGRAMLILKDSEEDWLDSNPASLERFAGLYTRAIYSYAISRGLSKKQVADLQLPAIRPFIAKLYEKLANKQEMQARFYNMSYEDQGLFLRDVLMDLFNLFVSPAIDTVERLPAPSSSVLVSTPPNTFQPSTPSVSNDANNVHPQIGSILQNASTIGAAIARSAIQPFQASSVSATNPNTTTTPSAFSSFTSSSVSSFR